MIIFERNINKKIQGETGCTPRVALEALLNSQAAGKDENFVCFARIVRDQHETQTTEWVASFTDEETSCRWKNGFKNFNENEFLIEFPVIITSSQSFYHHYLYQHNLMTFEMRDLYLEVDTDIWTKPIFGELLRSLRKTYSEREIEANLFLPAGRLNEIRLGIKKPTKTITKMMMNFVELEALKVETELGSGEDNLMKLFNATKNWVVA